MKKTKKPLSDLAKALILIAACLVIFVILLAVFSGKKDEYKYVSDTTYSSFDDGSLALYYSAEEMGKEYGFTVERYAKPARFIKEKSMVVCFYAGKKDVFYDDFEQSNVKKAIQNGSTYFLLGDTNPSLLGNVVEVVPEFYAGQEEEFRHAWAFYQLEEYEYEEQMSDKTPGYIAIYLGSKGWTNEQIKDSKRLAEDLLMLMATISDYSDIDTVLFNEYYLGIEEDFTVDVLTVGFVLCMVQLGIAAVLLMISLAKRFGKPVVEYSTVKRDENENVYAVASLYQRTNSYDVVFDIHAELMLSELGKTLGAINSDLHNYEYILELARSAGTETKYKGFKEIAETYTKPKKKVKNKRDLQNKLIIIEDIRRKLGDG